VSRLAGRPGTTPRGNFQRRKKGEDDIGSDFVHRGGFPGQMLAPKGDRNRGNGDGSDRR